jgi:hypothetical protein
MIQEVSVFGDIVEDGDDDELVRMTESDSTIGSYSMNSFSPARTEIDMSNASPDEFSSFEQLDFLPVYSLNSSQEWNIDYLIAS